MRSRTTAPIVVRTHGQPDLDSLASAEVDRVVDADAATRSRLCQAVLDRLGMPRSAIPAPDTGTRTWADTTRLMDYRWPTNTDCPHGAASQPVLPTAAGCLDCMREGLEWVHLRVCLSCGNVGCCDSSPGQHPRVHHKDTDHPLIASLEPAETWGYCFLDDTTMSRPRP